MELSRRGSSWLGEGLEKAESLSGRVCVGAVELICSAGQVSTEALAEWF